MVVVDAAGVSQVLLLERISHLSCCYPPAALKPFFIIFHASWRPHSAFLCAAPSSPPLHLLPASPHHITFSLNVIAHHFFSLFFLRNSWVSLFWEPLWEVKGQENFRVLHGNFSPKDLCFLRLNNQTSSDADLRFATASSSNMFSQNSINVTSCWV